MGLDDNYLQARSQILLMTPLPSVNQAYAMIIGDESQKAVTSNPAGLLGAMPDNVVMYSKANSQKFRKKYNLYCELCKMKNHTKENCYKLFGYPQDSTLGSRRKGEQENKQYTGLNPGNQSIPVQQMVQAGACSFTKEQGHCALVVVYIINRLPPSVVGSSPYEELYNHKPYIQHLKVIDCLCYAKNVAETDKLKSRVITSVLVGYFEVQKGYRLYDVHNQCFIVNRDVSFREDEFPFKWNNSIKHVFVDNLTGNNYEEINVLSLTVPNGLGIDTNHHTENVIPTDNVIPTAVIEDTLLSHLRTIEVGVDRFKIPDIILNPSLVQLAGGTASMQQLKEHLEKVLLEAARVKVLARGNATERRFRRQHIDISWLLSTNVVFKVRQHRESALTIVSLSEYTIWFMLMTGTKSMGHLTFKENALKKDDFAVIFYG
ncbi:hypothetical protein KY284_012284 [Solanum tuberosum]|nr:hypothetical protein KY284_012284 [Solanum tuberosum]